LTAFEAQYQANGIFEYLDHLFSPRYQYDWDNKEQWLKAHKKLINSIRSLTYVVFLSQQQCFDFVNALAEVQIRVISKDNVQTKFPLRRRDIAYRFKGKEHILIDTALF